MKGIESSASYLSYYGRLVLLVDIGAVGISYWRLGFLSSVILFQVSSIILIELELSIYRLL